MRICQFSAVVITALMGLAGCSSGGAGADATAGSGESDLSSSALSSFNAIMDSCTQTAIGAAALSAFADNNLQHFEGLTVDGTPGVQSQILTYTITTGNDEDGTTDRKVVVAETDDPNTGRSTCVVKSITPTDAGKASATAIHNAFGAVVDTCTKVAINAAAKKAFADNNLQHLHGFELDGDPAVDGLSHYSITTGNDEDGDTTYKVDVTSSFNRTTGKAACKVGKITSSR